MLVGTSCQPEVFFRIVGLDVQPEGVHTGCPEAIKVLRCEAVPVGFNQDPKAGLSFNETRAFFVKFWTAGKIPACEGDNVPCRTETLGTEEDILWIEDPRTGAGSSSARNAAPAASAGLLCMPGGRLFPWLLKGYHRFVCRAFL